MLLALLATLLILVIAFFQVIQGFFSAVIMTALSLLCMTIAFNYYEPLAGLLYPYHPAYAQAVSLLVLFVLPLLALRFSFDKYIGANVVLGVWGNRVYGGVFGLLTGMILVGILALVLQMLPLGPSILTYQPYDSTLTSRSRLGPLCPDDFVAGSVKLFSARSLGGGETFAKAHDNLVLELFASRNTAGKGGRIDATPNAMSVPGAFLSPAEGVEVPSLDEKYPKIVVVRTVIDSSARDSDGWWRLPGTHFRLVCERLDDSSDPNSRKYTSYYPLGYLGRSSGRLECVPAPNQEGKLQLANLIVERQGGKGAGRLTVDWAYRIAAEDAPSYIVFRRVSAANIGKLSAAMPSAAEALDAPVAPAETAQ